MTIILLAQLRDVVFVLNELASFVEGKLLKALYFCVSQRNTLRSE